mgnify:CR=1 FL=1
MAMQRYEVPSVFGTTYIFTDNPPAGASLAQDYQSQPPVNKPSLEQRIEVLEKAVSNLNNRLGIKTDSNSVDLDAASKLLESLDSSAATKTNNEISNAGATNAATVAAEPTAPSSSGLSDPELAAAIAKLTSSSSSAAEPVTPSSSGSAPVPSADDIAKQLGDLMS